MKTIARVFVLVGLGSALLAVSSAESWALPRRATLQGGECRCTCRVPGFISGRIDGLANQFGSCGVYNSRTCNMDVQDPATGTTLNRSGTTENYCQVLDDGNCYANGRVTPLLQAAQTATLSPAGGTTTQTPTVSPNVSTGATRTTQPATNP